tara:strand:+ start:431 stop:718 length:288 start_codon:yes stop_codon:yes gene_type:complete
MSQIDATDARLNTHEILCAERYKSIEIKMGMIDHRFDRIEQDLKEMKEINAKALAEIKSLLTAAKDEKFKVMVTVAGTVLVGMMGLMGYLVTHLK